MIDINEVAFVDIDTQKDFMEKGGALYINSSEEIKENLKKLTEFAVKKKIMILCSVDAHTENDPEFSKFPPHCIGGKEGYEKIDETKVEKFIIVPYEKEFIPEVRDYHQIIFEKKVQAVSISALIASISLFPTFIRKNDAKNEQTFTRMLYYAIIVYFMLNFVFYSFILLNLIWILISAIILSSIILYVIYRKFLILYSYLEE